MTGVLIFLSGVFISLITLLGFAFTVAEFKRMGRHPEEYPHDFAHLRPEEPDDRAANE